MMSKFCINIGNITKATFVLLMSTGIAIPHYAQTNKKASFAGTSVADLTKDTNPLTIGDKVPDFTFHNVLNYKSKTAKLSDFSGKVVILDMWSSNCTSCIKDFSKMEALQKKFGDKLQVLLVNPHDPKYDSEEKIKTTLDRLNSRTGYYPSLPIPIHDSILNVYFPHKSVPHIVWLGNDGKVLAITGSREVTEQNLQLLLKSEELSMAVKNDWGFDKKIPLLVDENGGDPNDFLYRSLFTNYKDGIGFSSGIRRNKVGEVIGIYMLNRSFREFITEAYSDIMNGVRNNRVILSVQNSDRFQREFNPDYAYCYDLTIPPTPWKMLNTKRYLQEDLKRYFSISAFKEKRKVKCLVLNATKKLNEVLTKYEKKERDIENDNIKKYFHNFSIDEALHYLDVFNTPLINETEFSKNIDIEFPDYFDLKNKNAVIQYLKNIGFAIAEEERELDVVVITDK